VVGQSLVGIDVHFADFEIAGQGPKGGLHRPAGSTPGGPEIDKDGLVGLKYLSLPIEFLQEHSSIPSRNERLRGVQPAQLLNHELRDGNCKEVVALI
jgi:hypothetical protein